MTKEFLYSHLSQEITFVFPPLFIKRFFCFFFEDEFPFDYLLMFFWYGVMFFILLSRICPCARDCKSVVGRANNSAQ